MSETKIGNSLNNLPAKGVVTPAKPGSPVQASVVVPQPSALVINGKPLPVIDLSRMNALDIVNMINNANIPGVKASLDVQGVLQISGIITIVGERALLQILGL